MPKKQLKEVSNIKLRRSKPVLKSPEYLTDEDEICFEDGQEEQYDKQYDKQCEVDASTTHKIKKQKKPKTNMTRAADAVGHGRHAEGQDVNFQSEREAFQRYVNEQRELLAKERLEYLEQIKQESAKEKAKNATNDARMRLMSIL